MKRKIFLSLLLIVVIAGGYFGYVFFKPAINNKENRHLYVKSGDDIATVKQKLVNAGLIKANGFDLVARILKFSNAKAGRYKVKDGGNLFSLVRDLRNGNQALVKIVIVKERTKEMFAGKFGTGKKFDTEFDSLQMLRFLNNNDSLKRFEVDTNTVMAIVMPYTYETKWSTTPGKVFQQFYNAHKKFWTPERKTKADSLNLSIPEVITLASIVEEETLKKADKLNIASTYINRVRTGMKLQADPTVKFAMKNFALKRIVGTHLKTDSPYNTYMYTGIPPGPICTPSIESIEAVLNAPKTDYLYFVASHKFDGTSIFTTNYDDHLKFARLYQNELTRRMDSAKKAKSQ